jgi:hypothetical protein
LFVFGESNNSYTLKLSSHTPYVKVNSVETESPSMWPDGDPLADVAEAALQLIPRILPGWVATEPHPPGHPGHPDDNYTDVVDLALRTGPGDHVAIRTGSGCCRWHHGICVGDQVLPWVHPSKPVRAVVDVSAASGKGQGRHATVAVRPITAFAADAVAFAKVEYSQPGGGDMLPAQASAELALALAAHARTQPGSFVLDATLCEHFATLCRCLDPSAHAMQQALTAELAAACQPPPPRVKRVRPKLGGGSLFSLF